MSFDGLLLVRISSLSFLSIYDEFLSFLLFYVLVRRFRLGLGLACKGSTILMLKNGCFNFVDSILIFLTLSEPTSPIASLITREVEPYFRKICN